jgi:membrane associated rhomboid family serine protease
VTDRPNSNLSEQSSLETPQRVFNLPPAIIAVVAVLIVVHGFLQFEGMSRQIFAQFAFAFIPIRFTSSIFPQMQGSAYWSMLTYGLLHADWTHLGFNSLWLIIFSKPVVLRLGSWRYLLLLALSIIGGAIAGLIVHWGEFVVMVGISAGVSGMIAAAIPIMYAQGGGMKTMTEKQVKRIHPLSPLQILQNKQAMVFTIMWLGLTMLTATSQYFTGTAFLEERVIAWEAHLGGFIAGLIAFYLLEFSSAKLKQQ